MCLTCMSCREVWYCSKARIHRRLSDLSKFSIVKCAIDDDMIVCEKCSQ